VNGLKVIKPRSFGSLGRKPPRVRIGEIPKRLGARLEPKNAHLHSEEHLALVRRQPCIITGKHSAVVERDGQRWMSIVIAHHPDESLPAQICAGRRCSDFLAVPLLAHLHDDFPGSLHKTNSAAWWQAQGVDPYSWLTDFLGRHYPSDHEGAAHALKLIAEVTANLGVRS
jgi:hypothetical protein